MINVSKIKKGIVLDHIEAGRAHVLYKALELDKVTDAVVPVSYTHLTLPTILLV